MYVHDILCESKMNVNGNVEKMKWQKRYVMYTKYTVKLLCGCDVMMRKKNQLLFYFHLRLFFGIFFTLSLLSACLLLVILLLSADKMNSPVLNAIKWYAYVQTFETQHNSPFIFMKRRRKKQHERFYNK